MRFNSLSDLPAECRQRNGLNGTERALNAQNSASPVQNGCSTRSNKFNAQKTEYNGILYHSKKEAEKAKELDLLVKAGEIDFYLRQVNFDLPGNIRYRADFVVFRTLDNGASGYSVIPWGIKVIEVKGMWTSSAKLKMKLFKESYPNLEVEIC